MTVGKTALVVEAEFLIALDLQRMLEAAGYTETMLARDAHEVEALLGRRSDVELALVELRLGDEGAYACITDLRRRGIAVICVTSDYEISTGKAGLGGLPVLTKPVSEEMFSSALHALAHAED